MNAERERRLTLSFKKIRNVLDGLKSARRRPKAYATGDEVSGEALRSAEVAESQFREPPSIESL